MAVARARRVYGAIVRTYRNNARTRYYRRRRRPGRFKMISQPRRPVRLGQPLPVCGRGDNFLKNATRGKSRPRISRPPVRLGRLAGFSRIATRRNSPFSPYTPVFTTLGTYIIAYARSRAGHVEIRIGNRVLNGRQVYSNDRSTEIVSNKTYALEYYS